MCAGEALTMPWFVLVCHTTGSDDLVALNAASGKFLFIAASTVDVIVARDERLGANRRLADTAAETLLMPLATLVLHLFGACSEDLSTSITTGGKGSIVAVGAVHLLGLGSKWLVHQRHTALIAKEACFMPVFLLV